MVKFIYRSAAIIAGMGWFVSIYTTIVNGPAVFEFLGYISSSEFEYHPMLDYWMKMAGIAFAFIGLGFIFCGIRWKKNLPLGKYFALYQIICFIGVVLSVLRLDLDSSIYVLDFAFFLGTGIPMLIAWSSLTAKKDR
ncbi:MAG: hypothetical protein OEQ53_04715 [Saprospiraceae bacterium]|nr:hypothetical protein [Saprospiraceae bacterium]